METVTAEFNPRTYIGAVKRRLPFLLAVVISVMMISVLLAWLPPPVYRSQAIILIEQ